jgi:hypothetical protein
MKLYISTPINGRKEPSFSEKYNAAKARIKEIESKYKDILSEYDTIVTTFDINPSGVTEAEAMGRCITEVLNCDAVLFDINWNSSSGCRLEYSAGKLYDKEMIFVLDLMMKIKQEY